MPYIYETHLHTKQASECALSSAKDYIPKYIDAGFKGIFITDHFFRGNTNIPIYLPWKEKVKEFSRGYMKAKNLGIQKGLDVFFGWEENYNGTEFLIYGLSPDWLMEHPEVQYWSIYDQFHAVNMAGGCVVQAHPFRDRFYIPQIRLYPHLVNAVEAYNGGNELSSDIRALKYAKKYNLPITAGSDIHSSLKASPQNLLGVAFERPLKDEKDFAKLIVEKQPLRSHIPYDRQNLDSSMLEALSIPVIYFDDKEKPFTLTNSQPHF